MTNKVNPKPTGIAKMAIDYFISHRIPCHKIGGNVVAWGCITVDVRYSTRRHYRGIFRWSLARPITADVVMLICDQRKDGGSLTFHLFDPDADVFFYHDGRQKTGVTFVAGRSVQLKHEQRWDSLTLPVMDEARDRLELVERARDEKARG